MNNPLRKPVENDRVIALAAIKLAEAFPEGVDPGITPFADRVLVQIKFVNNISAGGIVLPDGVVETEEDNTQVAKVLSLGPTAFTNQDTLAVWPEGKWCKPGEFVRIPMYGGDRWHVQIENPDQPRNPKKIRFAVIKDLDLIGLITCDPMKILAYL